MGSVFFLEGCSEDLCIFSFLSLLDTLSFCTSVLWPLSDSKHCIYLWYIYLMLLSFFTYLSMCCFFSLFIHMFLIMYAILYFCFTLRCLDEFCLKCFRNIGCQNLSCYELSSCQVFQEFVLGLDFIVFNKWLWTEWFMTSLIFYLSVVVLSRISKEGDC